MAALVAVLGGAAVYGYQRSIDRKITLAERRREVYVDFLSGLVDAANGDSTRHLRARIEALVVGSDNVVRQLADYNRIAEELCGTVDTTSTEFKDVLAKVTIAMREDVFEKTSISEQDYSDLLPVKRKNK